MNLIDLKDFLDEKVIQFNQPAFIQTDPIQVPRKFTLKEDIEIAGFLTATIAWGNRTAIIKNAERLMSLMNYQPYDFIINSSNTETDQLQHFVHRTFNGEDCIYFVKALKNIYTNHGGLQAAFEKGYRNEGSIKSALAYFYEIFFELSGERTRKHISNIQKGAAGKRLNMFLRWMVRNDKNEVDFGIWNGLPIPELMLPLDVHTGNVGRKLGILHRKSNDWKAVEEITGTLRKFDSTDPIKYDFALFGLGAFEKF
ncbi:MAG: TIGR02757 family protein [Draconibacterium sp.]|nr:TIGR02757 family protein [Draconibacterium sp.]